MHKPWDPKKETVRILVAPYWNLNLSILLLYIIRFKILVAPYWNLNLSLFFEK